MSLSDNIGLYMKPLCALQGDYRLYNTIMEELKEFIKFILTFCCCDMCKDFIKHEAGDKLW